MSKHIHILGIGGTFMGSLAQLAKAAGFRVTGCDTAVYPPMSTQLEAAGIELIEGFSESQLELEPDIYVVGNVVSRGNELMEAILNRGLPYVSGPQWLSENILQGRWVLAVAGTHGKTTTTSMLTWILEYAGFQPGYLIGGVPQNFDCSARLGGSDFFVVEADEYDTAFFDKRSKFVHYQAKTLILNNLEFDHADIFTDLSAIQTQFHHLVRTVAGHGLIIRPAQNHALGEVLEMGCWTEVQQSSAQEGLDAGIGEGINADWHYRVIDAERNSFELLFHGKVLAQVEWDISGKHNIENAVHAIAAARHIGIEPQLAAAALSKFIGVKRRMEKLGSANGVTVYDDFAHHPTAIQTTLEGLRKRVGDDTILAVIEPRSNTMRMGVHKEALSKSAEVADQVFWYEGASLDWSLAEHINSSDGRSHIFNDTRQLISAVLAATHANRQVHVVVMSNGGFGGMPAKLLHAFQVQEECRE